MEGYVFHIFGQDTTSTYDSVEINIEDGEFFDHHADDDRRVYEHHCISDVFFLEVGGREGGHKLQL